MAGFVVPRVFNLDESAGECGGQRSIIIGRSIVDSSGESVNLT